MSKSKVNKVYLTITIDTECDHDPNWVRSKPLTFNSITKGIPELLQPAFKQVGAIPTYLLTVEVMEDNDCIAALKSLKGNYEYGTHLHAAFIEPEKKFYDYAGVDSPDFQCQYSKDVEFKKLENLTNLFIEKFGYAPSSFRAGRYGAGINTFELLEKLGYKVDTSVTPHMSWVEPKAKVNYQYAPEQPYFPKLGSLINVDNRHNKTILEIPITVKRQWLRQPAWFRPWFSSVEKMKEIVQYHLEHYSGNEILELNMMFHSMEVIPKASPYPQSGCDVQRFIDDMCEVLSWCKGEGIEFCKTKDFYNKYIHL
ncbi:hypothetical protein MNBD_GAMMA22-2537 [hydrothermal vent metagenome]|uniref:NodB homology domain-containing protein n=1 Tax=hydrothermal vent metagenome TaxID=652676 RepID=A0A3B0ZF11_9ZZZZ